MWWLVWVVGCVAEKTPVVFTGDDLLDAIEGYEDWAQPTGWEGAQPSCDGTHGNYVEIWTNTLTTDALAAHADPLPDGATLVKQGYEDDRNTPKNLTVMRKLSGFDPDHGDWFWGQYDAEGNELASGAVTGCADCHAASAGDYVLFPQSVVVGDLAMCP